MTVAIDIFRVLTTCTSLVMLLSPSPSISNIYKKKSTGVGSIVPLVSMLTNAHVVMMFGYLSKQYFPVFSTFVIGDVLSLIYISVFYRYSHEKSKAHRVFLGFGCVLVGSTIYALLGGFGVTGQSHHAVANIVGYITILTSAVLYTSPMERIGLVLKHRSAVFINFHMICAGTLNNLMWIVYSTLAKQWIIFAPNAFCFAAGLFQITLYFIFHPSSHPLQAPEPMTEPLQVEIDLELAVAAGKTMLSSPSYVPISSPLAPLHKA